VACEIEFSDEFGGWWDSLAEDEQESVTYTIKLLEQEGLNLTRPHTAVIHGSSVSHLRELRCQHRGRPYRILYAFDPRRMAVLLIGGDKTGNARWYREFVPKAESIYMDLLKELAAEKRSEQSKEERDG
jgi:hypothetical protein